MFAAVLDICGSYHARSPVSSDRAGAACPGISVPTGIAGADVLTKRELELQSSDLGGGPKKICAPPSCPCAWNV